MLIITFKLYNKLYFSDTFCRQFQDTFGSINLKTIGAMANKGNRNAAFKPSQFA